MLSQFYAIFANFREKVDVFSSKTNAIITCLQTLVVIRAKNVNFFPKFIGKNIFENHCIGR
jgi:hypothetical protein